MGRRRGGARPTTRSFTGLAGLPPEGVAWLNSQCEQRRQGIGPTAQQVLAELQRRWGIEWNDSSLSSYQAFYETTLRIEAQAHDEAITLAKHFMARGPEAEGDLRGILEHSRLVALSRMGGADPIQVYRTLLAHDRTELTRQKLSLDKEKKALQDEKLAIDKARLELEREKKLAIDKPALFLEAFKLFVETVQGDPEAAAVLSRNFDRFMAQIKAAA